MSRYGVLIALWAVAAFAGRASAVSEGAVGSLYIQPGGRPAGMGDCYVAAVDDASAVSWNPAGLASLRDRRSVVLMHTQLVPDFKDVYYEYAAYAQRIEGLGTIGFSVIYTTFGEQIATTADPEEDPIGTFKSWEVIPSLAYGLSVSDNLSVGLGLKFAYSDLAPAWATQDQQKGAGSTYAVDGGVLYAMDEGRLRLGCAVQNVGPKLAYIDERQADPLPRNLKLGAAYTLLADEMNDFMVCCEYNKALVIVEDFLDQTSGVVLNTGAEYTYYDLLALRLGYQYDEDGKVKGFHFGLGLQYKNLAFDVATVPQAEGLNRPFRVSMRAAF